MSFAVYWDSSELCQNLTCDGGSFFMVKLVWKFLCGQARRLSTLPPKRLM
ncbi:hypothetical protein KY285_033516 [Solanum tuberosum]|nr:hypothetical protein KY285_033516 [Solanum tuberosum]